MLRQTLNQVAIKMHFFRCFSMFMPIFKENWSTYAENKAGSKVIDSFPKNFLIRNEIRLEIIRSKIRFFTLI